MLLEFYVVLGVFECGVYILIDYLQWCVMCFGVVYCCFYFGVGLDVVLVG